MGYKEEQRFAEMTAGFLIARVSHCSRRGNRFRLPDALSPPRLLAQLHRAASAAAAGALHA